MPKPFGQWKNRETKAVYEDLIKNWGNDASEISDDWFSANGTGAAEHLATQLKEEYRACNCNWDENSKLIEVLVLSGLQRVDWFQVASRALLSMYRNRQQPTDG